MKPRRILYIVIFLLTSGLLLSPIFFKDFLKDVESLGLIGIFLINFFTSATLFLPAPGIFSVALGGSLYNPLLVALFASLGASLGEGIGYLFGFSSQKVINLQKHKITFHLMKFTFDKYGVIIVFLFSLIPNPFFDGIGILAGISGFSGFRFLGVVFLGRLIRNTIVSYFGHYM